MRETIKLARSQLDVKNNPNPIERKIETKQIRNLIINSLQTLKKGRNLSNINNLNNIYVCGLPGFGKTLTVENLLKKMVSEQSDRNNNINNNKNKNNEDVACRKKNSTFSSNKIIKKTKKNFGQKMVVNEEEEKEVTEVIEDEGESEREGEGEGEGEDYETLPQFNVVEFSGTMLHSDNCYQIIAKRLKIDLSNCIGTVEKSAREKVLKIFRNEQQCIRTSKGSGKEVFPITILLIDEIDKAPKKLIKELLEIMGETTSTSTSTSSSTSIHHPQYFGCSLILIGLANDLTFSFDIKVSYDATERFKVVPFKPYEIPELQSILNHRCLGLFDSRATYLMAARASRSERGNIRK